MENIWLSLLNWRYPVKYCGVSQEQCSSQVDQTSVKAEIKHNFSCIDIMHIAVSVHHSTKKKKKIRMQTTQMINDVNYSSQ